MAQEVTVTQRTPDGVEKEFTFSGEIVKNVVGALEAQGGKRRRTRNRKHKRKLRTAKKSM